MTDTKHPLSRWLKCPLAGLIMVTSAAAMLASYALTAPYMLRWLYRIPALVFGVSGVTACLLCYLWLKGKLGFKRLPWLIICTLINALALVGLLASR